jgi:glycosyltransferase involved in cell wall biosynthesis
MIRILHTIDTAGPGGAETVFVTLATGLDNKKFKSFAAIPGPGWVCDQLIKVGMEPIFVSSKGGFNFCYLIKLVKIIKSYKIDLVQSHLLGSNVYSSLAGLICRVPVVSTFHGFVDANEGDKSINMKRWLINRGSVKIIFVSDRLKEHFVQIHQISSIKAVTIYNGVNTIKYKPDRDENIRNELGIRPDNILVGAVGNIRTAKGYEYLVKAARIVCDLKPECRFIIAGQGDGELLGKLLKIIEDLELEAFFTLVGFREDCSKLYNNLDIFVLPSVSEGFSISTIEAMACGIPLVLTRSGGPEEIVGKKSFELVEVKDESALAKAIIDRIDNAEQTKRSIEQGIDLVQERFSTDKMISNYVNIYTEILNCVR